MYSSSQNTISELSIFQNEKKIFTTATSLKDMAITKIIKNYNKTKINAKITK